LALYYPGAQEEHPMMHTRTFPRGGVYPPQTCEPSRREPVTNAAVPARALIPMRQHAGSPAECLVRPGDHVREGMVIGKAFGPHSAHVHASIPGRVVEIRKVADACGEDCPAVLIDLEGEFDRSGRGRTSRSWEGLSRVELLGSIQAAGIVELAGSLEPAHLRLALPPGAVAGLFVANGVESDPSLSCVSAILREKPREIVEGIRIARRLLGSCPAILAVGEADAHLVPGFERAIDDTGEEIGIVVVSSRYPQAHDELLLAALAGGGGGRRGASSRSLADASGRQTVTLGAATLLAVEEAVVLNTPLIEGVVTVGGSPVRNPRNLKARFGTPIGELIDECGGFAGPAAAVVLGGLMTGRAVASLDAAFTKGITGVIVLSEREARVPHAHPCIGCGRCIDACPWGLEPTRLFKLLDHGRLSTAIAEGLAECSACGCCAFVCPSRIPLARMLGEGKIEGTPRGN
jgi:Na+-translocating ferredoxin:NAD+ oxidoreductase subunit C